MITVSYSPPLRPGPFLRKRYSEISADLKRAGSFLPTNPHIRPKWFPTYDFYLPAKDRFLNKGQVPPTPLFSRISPTIPSCLTAGQEALFFPPCEPRPLLDDQRPIKPDTCLFPPPYLAQAIPCLIISFLLESPAFLY